uniref:Uncharacterized protein n=1 Tax=Nymphaea colorata TaxID=210225 RepID=A0A5K0XXH2_9MAGN
MASIRSSNSRLDPTCTSRSRFTATALPSSSTALYDVPRPPFPSISAEALSRSSSSKRLSPSRNTILPLSNPPPAPAGPGRPHGLDDEYTIFSPSRTLLPARRPA